jgi:CubicO group peptidase (beta-lactamase class C family)
MAVHGSTTPDWEPVAEALERVVAQDRGAGSAVCVYLDGQPVVDLWGGDTGTGHVWGRETAACVFSATKGVAALCVHLLVQRGLLDLDQPVSRYWPEFAGGGKQDLLVRWLLTHEAGLVRLDPDFTLDQLLDGEPVLRAIEAQQPIWEPGTHHGYHALTYGFLVGELVRRVTGRSLGRFFHHEVADPLGLTAWLGLPQDADVDLARLEPASTGPNPLEAMIAADPDGPWAQAAKVLTLGGALPLGLVGDGDGDFNDRRLLAVELPAANLVTDARSLARVYAATVSTVDGVRLLDDQTAAGLPTVHTSRSTVFGSPPDAPRTLDFGLGFLSRPMLGPSCFGHPGASGSLGFADVSRRLGFGYVPRLVRQEGVDTRTAALLDAVRQCLG